MNWPCLSAAPPSYTEDTTNFPNGESAPPSRAMSSCPALQPVNKNNQTGVVHFKSDRSSNEHIWSVSRLMCRQKVPF